MWGGGLGASFVCVGLFCACRVGLHVRFLPAINQLRRSLQHLESSLIAFLPRRLHLVCSSQEGGCRAAVTLDVRHWVKEHLGSLCLLEDCEDEELLEAFLGCNLCVSRWLRDGMQQFRGFPELTSTCFSRLLHLVFHRLTIMQVHMTTPKVCLCGWLYANLLLCRQG